jgi:hypothetical protein
LNIFIFQDMPDLHAEEEECSDEPEAGMLGGWLII